MTKISANDPLLKSIPIDKFVSYLENAGWRRINHPNHRIILFEGPLDDEGEPLQLILPRHRDLEDADSRLAEALTLLSIIQTEPLNSVIQRVNADNVNEDPSEPKPITLWWHTSTKPAFLFTLGAILIIMIGIFGASYYNAKNELNRMRMDRFNEILSKVYGYEETVEGIMEEFKVREQVVNKVRDFEVATLGTNEVSGFIGEPRPRELPFFIPKDTKVKDLKEMFEQSKNVQAELNSLLDKNKVWLGEDAYNIIKNYTDSTVDYYFALKSGRRAEEFQRKRTQAKNALSQVKERILTG